MWIQFQYVESTLRWNKRWQEPTHVFLPPRNSSVSKTTRITKTNTHMCCCWNCVFCFFPCFENVLQDLLLLNIYFLLLNCEKLKICLLDHIEIKQNRVLWWIQSFLFSSYCVFSFVCEWIYIYIFVAVGIICFIFLLLVYL